MRRAILALATTLTVGAGFFAPAQAATDSGPTDAITAGTVTIVTGHDPIGTPTWTTTISGQVAAGGLTYSGTATGSNIEAQTTTQAITLAGTSATGSINMTCLGGPNPPPTPPPLIDDNCSVSIDGASNVNIEVVFAVAPAGLTTYKGVYGAVPDAEGLPSLPVSLGTASANVGFTPTENSVSFGFDGQITLGGQTYHGQASGTTDITSGTELTIDVPSFTLSGTSSTGSLSATCSGEFISVPLLVDDPLPALSVLSCDGSANGGPSGHATLVSLYRQTGVAIHFGVITTYGGLFTGV